jgi:DedD protein
MDRRVKERLVGASILVVLIVLIVPELLSGPARGPMTPFLPGSTPEPTRNVTVDLATNKTPAPEIVPEPAAASSAEAARTVAGSVAPPVVTADPPVTAAPPAVPPPPLETASPPPRSAPAAVKPVSAGHAWNVQLGSFASHDNADRLLRQLKTQGFSAFVSPGGSGASRRYRVRIGPLADHGAAMQEAAKLKSSGHVASIVAPGALN